MPSAGCLRAHPSSVRRAVKRIHFPLRSPPLHESSAGNSVICGCPPIICIERSSPVPPQVRRHVKRDGAERGLTLVSVSLLISCGVNRLQSYVLDMIAIARLLRCCKTVTSTRRRCSKRVSTWRLTLMQQTTHRNPSALRLNDYTGRMVAKSIRRTTAPQHLHRHV